MYSGAGSESESDAGDGGEKAQDVAVLLVYPTDLCLGFDTQTSLTSVLIDSLKTVKCLYFCSNDL